MQGGRKTLMKIEVLGSGCKNCEDLYRNVLKAVEMAGLGNQAEVTKVSDVKYFFQLGVLTTPALVVDGKVLSVARLLAPEEIFNLFRQKEIIG
jgi:small redox-active disulfide protein 2